MQGEEIPLGSRILKVALDYDQLLRAGYTPIGVHKKLQNEPAWYDPTVVDSLGRVVTQEDQYVIKDLRISELLPGMILVEDIVSAKGILIMTAGQEVSPPLCARLHNFVAGGLALSTIKVTVPTIAVARQKGSSYNLLKVGVWEGNSPSCSPMGRLTSFSVSSRSISSHSALGWRGLET